MTSEPDSTPRRRPPTIDLTATEIETEKPAAEPGGTHAAGDRGHAQGAAEGRWGTRFTSRLRPHAISAAAGAVALAAIVFGLWLAGVLPAENSSPPAQQNGTGEISAQLDKVQAALQSRPADTALDARVATIEAQTKALSESLAAINRRLDDVAAATQSARERADGAAAAATGAAQSSVQRGDLDAFAGRIAALEQSIKTLSAATAQRPASAGDRAARAAVAAEALRAVVERGAPYTAELATVKSLGADQAALAALQPFAAAGVPTAAALGHELSQLTASLLQPASGVAPSGGGFLGRLESNAKSLVRIAPVDATAGEQPSAVVARLQADASRADIAAALADIAGLPQSAKIILEPWVQKANARAAAIAASQRIAAAALAGLGDAGTQ
jgi:hypothetical protein